MIHSLENQPVTSGSSFSFPAPDQVYEFHS